MTETTKPAFSTKAVHDNERIVIDPPTSQWVHRERTHLEKVRELEEIRSGILRHVDDTSQRNVQVVWDTKTCCTHCGEPVALGCIHGAPYCCDAAQAEWTASGGTLAL